MLARLTWAPIGVLCLTSVGQAQITEFTYLHGGHAHGIACIDDPLDGKTRCANVGDGGRIRYSDDAGVTWDDAIVDLEYRGHFRQVYFLNPTNAWAVGQGGAIHYSSDRGESWTWVNKGTPIMNSAIPSGEADLYDIWMTSTTNGWVVGKDGVLLRTTNGWTTSSPPSGTLPDFTAVPGGSTDPADPYDIQIFGATGQHLFVPADWGFYCYSNDWGTNWSYALLNSCWQFGSNTDIDLWGAEFDPTPNGAGEHDGWMVGGNGTNGGMLYHSTDSGQSWSPVTHTRYTAGVGLPTQCVQTTMYGIEWFPSWSDGVTTHPAEVLSVGYGASVLRYEAVGGTGITVQTPCDPFPPTCTPHFNWSGTYWDKFLPDAASLSIYAAAEAPKPPLTSIFSLDGERAWITGRFGVVPRSTDGGVTWTAPVEAQQIRLASAEFSSSSTGVAIGQGNVIVRTANHGEDWSVVSPTSGTVDNDQSGIDIALASGGGGVAIGTANLILYSTNHGATWSAPTSAPAGTWRGVDVETVTGGGGTISNAFLCGESGLFANSTDGGVTWTAVSDSNLTGKDFRGVDFTVGLLDTVGYLAGDAGAALRSTDGGDTWTAMAFRSAPSPLPDFLAVATIGAGDEAVFVGRDAAVYSRNNLGQLVFHDVATLCGEPALATVDFFGVELTDGGSTWILVGEGGTVVRNDGGTWTAPKSKTDTKLHSASFSSGSDGHVVGQQFYVGRWN